MIGSYLIGVYTVGYITVIGEPANLQSDFKKRGPIKNQYSHPVNDIGSYPFLKTFFSRTKPMILQFEIRCAILLGASLDIQQSPNRSRKRSGVMHPTFQPLIGLCVIDGPMTGAGAQTYPISHPIEIF